MVVGTKKIKAVEVDSVATGLSKFVNKIFLHLVAGIGLSAVACYLFIRTGLVMHMFTMNSSGAFVGISLLGNILMWGPLAFILAISFWGKKSSTNTLKVLYYAFCAFMGISISAIMLIYLQQNPAVVYQALAITTLDVGAMALVGFYTKKNLDKIGMVLYMAMFGLLFVVIAGALFGFSIGIWLSYAIVLIFSGLISWDIQKAKDFYLHYGEENEETDRMVIWTALNLFISFVNILISLMRILGRK